MTLDLKPKIKRHVWTQKDLDIIKGKYDGTNNTICVLEQAIGASHQAIKQKAIMLGLTRRQRYAEWTDEDKEKLEALTPIYSPKKIGEMLKRTENSVRAEQARLKFSPTTREWYTAQDVATICAVHFCTVERWIKSGALKANRYQNENGLWQIRPQDLKAFILRFPAELQGRKVDMVTLVDLLTNVKADGK